LLDSRRTAESIDVVRRTANRSIIAIQADEKYGGGRV